MTEAGIRHWLRRADIDRHFKWVVTSVDARYRKPDKRFFDFALKQCGLKEQEVLFVGNQLNTDIEGAAACGIQSVWLSGIEYRSPDDTLTPDQVRPSYIIHHLRDLPILLGKLQSRDCSREVASQCKWEVDCD